MSDNKAPWVKIGEILKKKDGSGTYIKLDLRKGKEKLSSITLTNGSFLTVLDPRKRAGITEEQLEKIPDFVRAELFLAPPRD